MPSFQRILFTRGTRFQRFTPQLEVNDALSALQPAIRNIWVEHTVGNIDSSRDKDHWRPPVSIGCSPPHAITVADNRITHKCFIARCNRPRYSRELRRKSRTSHRYSSRSILDAGNRSRRRLKGRNSSSRDRSPWHFVDWNNVVIGRSL